MEQKMVAEKVPLMTSKLQFYPDLLASASFLPQKAPPFFDHIAFYWLGLVPNITVQSILFLEKLPPFEGAAENV